MADGKDGNEIEVPFVFVGHGDPLPLEWMARHPGWVKFPATLVPRPVPRRVVSGKAWDVAGAGDAFGHGATSRPVSVGAPVVQRRRVPVHRLPTGSRLYSEKDAFAAYLQASDVMDNAPSAFLASYRGSGSTTPPPIDVAKLPPGPLRGDDYETAAKRNLYLERKYDPSSRVDRTLNVATRAMSDPANVLTDAERAEHQALTAKFWETLYPQPTPEEARLDVMLATPLGTTASVVTRELGGDQQAQDLALGLGAAGEGVGLALAGARAGPATQFLDAQTGEEATTILAPAASSATAPKLAKQLLDQNLTNIAAQDSRLAAAVKGSGNSKVDFSIGTGNVAEANRLGLIWVGDGATPMTGVPGGLVSADKNRTYRPPEPKSSPFASTGVQANFVRLEYGNIVSNGHLNVLP